MKNQLENLMVKEMSRKEFLQYVGSGLLVMFGISGLIKALVGNQLDTRQSANDYGFSTYGGKR